MTEKQEDISEIKANLTYPSTLQNSYLDKPCHKKPNTKPKKKNQKKKKKNRRIRKVFLKHHKPARLHLIAIKSG